MRIHVDEHGLHAATAAYFTPSGSSTLPLHPDLHQITQMIAACIRAYVGALPTDELVDRMREHADAEIDNNLRYVVATDDLLWLAADRIAMLEAALTAATVQFERQSAMSAVWQSRAESVRESLLARQTSPSSDTKGAT